MAVVIIYRHFRKKENKSKVDAAKYNSCNNQIKYALMHNIFQELVESDYITFNCDGTSLDCSNNFRDFH